MESPAWLWLPWMQGPHGARSLTRTNSPSSLLAASLHFWFLLWTESGAQGASHRVFQAFLTCPEFPEPPKGTKASTQTPPAPLLPPTEPLENDTQSHRIPTDPAETAIPKVLWAGHTCQACHEGIATAVSLEQRASCYSPLSLEMAASKSCHILAFFCPIIRVMKSKWTALT